MTRDVNLEPSRTDALIADGGSTHYLSQGDLRPPVEAALVDGGTAHDLSDAREVRFRMTDKGDGSVLVDARADIVDAENGEVRYEWSRGQTDSPGLYRARFVAKYTGGETLSFPNHGAVSVIIERK